MQLPETTPEFEALLNYLKHKRGCDLTGYKRSTLLRRVGHRMQALKLESYQSYLEHLHGSADEHQALLNDVLINFTGFFRNLDAWAYLAADIVPQILASKQPDAPIRIWSAGCSTGQEIYSLLILLAEELGVEFCQQQIQCHATDVDAEALHKAQSASYSNWEVINIPAALLEKYLEKTEQGYAFHPELHRLVKFEQHDLMKDRPLEAIDLLVCRNVLMYFTIESQKTILTHFYSALNNTGFLFTGPAEVLAHHRQLFTPGSLKQRIYIKSR